MVILHYKEFRLKLFMTLIIKTNISKDQRDESDV